MRDFLKIPKTSSFETNMKTKLLALAFALICAMQISSQAQTVADAQKQAAAKYPDLSRAGTPLNTKFVELYREASASNPTLLSNPNWPVILADKAAALIVKTPSAPNITTPPAAPAPKPAAPAEPPPADDLPYPLGNTTEAISCGDEFNYHLTGVRLMRGRCFVSSEVCVSCA